MKNSKKIITVLVLITVLLSLFLNSSFVANVATEQNDQKTVIEKMVNSINAKDIQQYISLFTQANQNDMKIAATKSTQDTFFKERNMKLVNLKKLPADVGISAASISSREGLDLSQTEVYYAELDFKVDRQEKWMYNGVNSRVIVLTKEDGLWKIARISVPEIEYIVSKGQGFGTESEKKQLILKTQW